MPKDTKVSRILIGNIMLFVNTSMFFQREIIYIMTLTVAHWDTWDDDFSS